MAEGGKKPRRQELGPISRPARPWRGRLPFPPPLQAPWSRLAGELKAVGRNGLGDTIAQSGFGHCHQWGWPHWWPLSSLDLFCVSPSTAGFALARAVDMDEDPRWVWVLGRLQGSAGTWWWPGTKPQRKPEAAFALQAQGLLSLNGVLGLMDKFLHSQAPRNMMCVPSHHLCLQPK